MLKRFLKTEDTGKIFEYAICLAYNISYDGPYKYSVKEAELLKERLEKLPQLFPTCKHTAKRGSRYDYTASTEPDLHLSAKTSKNRKGKVAPQVIGQSQPRKFCELLGIPFVDIPTLKKHIQENPVQILPLLLSYTLDCPNIYYNKELETIRFITMKTPIDWTKYTYSWSCNWHEWNNSSVLKIVTPEKTVPLVEFQFHSKSRTNMAVRWCYDEFLTFFNDNLNIVTL